MEPTADRDEIAAPRLRLVLMKEPFIRAVLEDRRVEAERLIGAVIPTTWPEGEGDLWLLNLRLEQMLTDPDSTPWLVRAVVRRDDDVMIGHAGFHGKPDEQGVPEVGYTIFEEARRRGYAEETARALFAWAAKEHGVRRFRASVGPWNEPSLALVGKLGFVKVGRQWDDRDGEELIFEATLGDRRSLPDH